MNRMMPICVWSICLVNAPARNLAAMLLHASFFGMTSSLIRNLAVSYASILQYDYFIEHMLLMHLQLIYIPVLFLYLFFAGAGGDGVFKLVKKQYLLNKG